MLLLNSILILIIIASLIASVYKWKKWGFGADLLEEAPTQLKWIKRIEWTGMAAVIIYWCIALSGCTKDVPRDVIVPSGAVTVNVPVPTCGDDLAKTLFVTPVAHPASLPIHELTEADKDNYDKVSKAYIETIQLLTEYAVALERTQSQAQQQCKATRAAVDTLNTKTPVIPAQK